MDTKRFNEFKYSPPAGRLALYLNALGLFDQRYGAEPAGRDLATGRLLRAAAKADFISEEWWGGDYLAAMGEMERQVDETRAEGAHPVAVRLGDWELCVFGLPETLVCRGLVLEVLAFVEPVSPAVCVVDAPTRDKYLASWSPAASLPGRFR